MHRSLTSLIVAAPLLSAALLSSNPADACGGCFVPPSSSTVVSGHRMALSVSMKQTVLWDQIQYQGNPEDFSWVLPIKPGARVEQASAAWFETLDAATTTVVQAPPLNCGNGGSAFGCGSQSSFAAGAEDSGGTGGGVTVVHQETVGPYDSVTLSSKDSGALTSWLESHSYDIPEDVKPIIAAYVAEGFDFIALRLTPGNGVNLMSPVRVITQGASPVLPLRMVAAGTGPFTSIILYVLGEGRWTTSNFPSAEVPFKEIEWDGKANDSNYASLRQQTMQQDLGRTWITTYAKSDALLASQYDYEFGSTGFIGYSYIQQVGGPNNTDYEKYNACSSLIESDVNKGGVVVDPCDHADPEVCGSVGPGQLDARDFECGELTDLATAMVGMHPNDVWVTRLEANLPRTALVQDLVLGATADQSQISNFHEATKATDYECPASPVGSGGSSKGGKSSSGNGTAVVLVGLGAVAALFAARRRRGLIGV